MIALESRTDSGRGALSGLKVLLVATYEMGRQPFGLASPAAWLRERGADVCMVDASRDGVAPTAFSDAHLVAFHLPMHTATRLAIDVIERAAHAVPRPHLCAYGLYAPLNATQLRALGVATILGGEFEAGLVRVAERLATGAESVGARPAGRARDFLGAARLPGARPRRPAAARSLRGAGDA